MKPLKIFIYVVIVILLLEVIKTLLAKNAFMGSYFMASVLAAIQFFLLAFFILWIILKSAFSKFKFRNPSAVGVFVSIVLFVMAELASLFLLRNPSKIPSTLLTSFQYYYDYNCKLIQFKKEASVYDSSLFYKLNPSSNFIYAQQEFADSFTINSIGVRDDERSLKSPQVICLGDSYTMGWGVSQQEVYTSELERLSQLNVLNTGISSFGTAREITLLKKLDRDSLKYIVIQYCANDLDENKEFIKHNGVLPVSGRDRFDDAVASQEWNTSYFPGKCFFTVAPFISKRVINKVKAVFSLRFDRELPVTNAKEHAEYLLKALTLSGIDFPRVKVIITMMDSWSHMHSDVLKELRNSLSADSNKNIFGNHIKVLDLVPVLSVDDFYTLDLHIKPSGHKKIAAAIWNVMKGE